ncbi:MAG: RNA polymerase sigma factor [Planctomycetes bacterium]|nr:RNA polymerase sigma factor [Planctomycetota bacterium]
MNGSLETKPEKSGDPTTISPSVRDRLVRLAYRFLWNRDDAEDAVQEALTVAHQKRSDLRDSSKWWSWVRRIVVQQCHVTGRRSVMLRNHAERLVLENAGLTAEAPDPTSGELKELVRRLIDQLPPRQREVVVLRHLEDLPFETIAELLEISTSTARVHAAAGRQRLRELILQRYPEWAVPRSEHRKSNVI